MFIALRDLRFAKGRFFLMGLVVALVAYLMTLLSGLSAGLIKNNISGLMALDVSHIAFEWDDKPNYRNSMVDRAMWEGYRDSDGVKASEPIGHTMFNARSQNDDAIEIVLWGIAPGSFLEPLVENGAQLGEDEAGVLISHMLADKGIEIGDTIVLDRVLTELKVVGVTDERNIGHVPIVFANIRKWQEATYGPPGGPPPGETLPDILFDYASVIALQLADDLDVAAIDDEVGTTTRDRAGAYEASTGYREEIFSVQMIQGFLIVISAVVIGAFFTTWTMQRTQEIGLVKALGASSAYLLRDALGQALILLLASTLVGVGFGVWSGRAFEQAGNPFMLQQDTVAASAALLVFAGLVGGAMSVRLITRVDPMIALGRER